MGNFLFLYLVCNARTKSLKILLALIAVALFSLSYHKAIVIFFIISLFLMHTVKHYGFFLDKKKYIMLVLLFFVGLGCLSLLLLLTTTRKTYCLDAKDRISCAMASNSYKTLEYIRENHYFSYGMSSFGFFIKKWECGRKKLYRISYNLTFGAPIDTELLPATSCPTPCPVSLYADFRWFSLLFIFVLGAFLKLYDNTMINYLETEKDNSFSTAAYVLSMIFSLIFCMDCIGSAILSGGFGPMAFLSILGIKYGPSKNV
jgi:hypothetical protein